MASKTQKPPALVTRNGSEMSCLAADNSDPKPFISEYQTHQACTDTNKVDALRLIAVEKAVLAARMAYFEALETFAEADTEAFISKASPSFAATANAFGPRTKAQLLRLRLGLCAGCLTRHAIIAFLDELCRLISSFSREWRRA